MHSHPFLKLKISTLFVTYYFTKKTPHRQGNREKAKEKMKKATCFRKSLCLWWPKKISCSGGAGREKFVFKSDTNFTPHSNYILCGCFSFKLIL